MDGQTFQVSEVTIDGAAEHDQMGSAIALANNAVLVASPYYGSSVGTAILYTRGDSASSLRRSAQFFGPNSFESFGAAVAMSKDHIFIGAPGEACYIEGQPVMSCGAVFVYARYRSEADQSEYAEDNGWFRRSIFPKELGSNSNFGASLAISSSGALAVGAPGQDGFRGSVHVFKRNELDAWESVAYFESPSKDYYGKFGFSLGFDGDVLIVGAPGDSVNGLSLAGSVSIYRDFGSLSGSSSWGLVQQILPSDPTESGEFGTSISISDQFIVVGAPMAPGHSEFTGAAYIYAYNAPSDTTDAGWTQVDRVIAFDGEAGDMFGCSISMQRETLAVGACGENGKLLNSGEVWQPEDGDNCGILSDPGCVPYAGEIKNQAEDAGALYVFVYNHDEDGEWTPIRKILAPNSGRHWRFGWSVLTDGDTIIVSADGAGSSYTQTGAVYEILIDWSYFDNALGSMLRSMLIGAAIISVFVFGYVLYMSKAHDFMFKNNSSENRGTSLDISNSGQSATSSQFLLGSFVGGSSSYASSVKGAPAAMEAPAAAGVISDSDRGLGRVEWGISRPPRRAMKF